MNYKARRAKLINSINDGEWILLNSGGLKQSSYDESYPFEVNMNFYYLTGINQDEVTLILKKENGQLEEHLFIYQNDEKLARWIGYYLTPEEATLISGVENIHFNEELSSFLTGFISKSKFNTVYLDLEQSSFSGDKIASSRWETLLQSILSTIEIKNAYPLVTKLRAVKDEDEIEALRNSIHITKLALEKVMQELPKLKYEYQVQAVFEKEIKSLQNANTSFATIAASGKNAAVLHYHQNEDQLNKKEMILLDLGAEKNKYNADISRTYPTGGSYNKLQRLIYEIVLYVNETIIEFIRPGKTIKELQVKTIELFQDMLLKNKLIKDKEEVHNYYFHSVSHHLGLDTHDPMARDTILEKGMVITVEPGLYFKDLGIGVRIEDDVLVTENGSENLSSEIIKNPAEIEAYIKGHREN